MDQKNIRMEVGEILDTYCEGCFLKQYHRSKYGKKFAQRFCIRECTVGEKLRQYGEKLTNFSSQA